MHYRAPGALFDPSVHPKIKWCTVHCVVHFEKMRCTARALSARKENFTQIKLNGPKVQCFCIETLKNSNFRLATLAVRDLLYISSSSQWKNIKKFRARLARDSISQEREIRHRPERHVFCFRVEKKGKEGEERRERGEKGPPKKNDKKLAIFYTDPEVGTTTCYEWKGRQSKNRF